MNGANNKKQEKSGHKQLLQNLMVQPGSVDAPSHSNTSGSIIHLTDNDRKNSDIGLLSQAPSNPDKNSIENTDKQNSECNSSEEKRSRQPIMAQEENQIQMTPERCSVDSSDLRMTQRQLEAEIKMPRNSSAKKRMNADHSAITI